MSATTSRPALRKGARRQQKSYKEPMTDSDEDFGTPPPKRTLPTRASRAFRAAYNDNESDSESDSDEMTSLSDVEPKPAPKQARPSKPVTRSSVPTKTKRKAPIERNVFQTYKRKKTVHLPVSKKPLTIRSVTVNIPSSSRIPKWQDLPYQILLTIMRYASYPLYTGASRDTGSARWLLNTSQLCRSFHDACIGALMYNPPLFPAHRAHWLVDLLKASARDYGIDHSAQATTSKRLSLDYRKKVKSLDVEAKQILVKKAGIDIGELLHHTPLLKHLRIYHNHDSLSSRYIWAKASHARSKGSWSYGDLFKVLDEHNIQLTSFEWNGRFMLDDPLLFKFHDVSCGSQCLSRLRSITLRNLNLPEVEVLNENVVRNNFVPTEVNLDVDPKTGKLLTWRINILKALTASSELESLAIFDSNIIDDGMIKDFPSSLKCLEISNCAFAKSEGIQSYLQAKGSSLTHLALRGNQLMSLAFTKTLSTNAPRLQELDIDLTYHDPTSFRDTEPLFDELLPAGPPTWPSSLERISIGPLRSLSAEDAEKFYQSLADAAPHLPNLRFFELRTILNSASWRDRASLRDKWAVKLDAIFHVKHNAEAMIIDVLPLRSNTHDSTSDSDSQRRTRSRKEPGVNLDNTEDRRASAEYGHGRCHTVLFELSNQRPAQEQYTEGDFLDEPADDDDAEWDGRDRIEPPKYSSRRYAW